MWPLRSRKRVREIEPDEIFLDSSNLPFLDADQFEGRVEYPLSRAALLSVGLVFGIGSALFLAQAFSLQVVHGEDYAEISRENRLERAVIFAPRGIMYDRTGSQLAWNGVLATFEARENATSTPIIAPLENGEAGVATSSDADSLTETPSHALRRYIELSGFAHLVGFVQYPRQDAAGLWWREDYAGVSGAEYIFDDILAGENGSRLVETNARGEVVRQHIVIPPASGRDITLSIDADVQHMLATTLSQHAAANNFQGGAAVIMDVETGELLALTNFPEYDNAAFADGDATIIGETNGDPLKPLLNRAVSGLYTPGSIVKPIFAAAALAEKIIDAETEILSTGQLVVPNPYDPDKPTIFRDWKAHGWVNMRAALAVSSDQYFYTVGGGFEGQKGLGIARLDEYARRFGLGSATGIAFSGEPDGVIPTPEWKAETFGGDPWRLGDTYITAIGQFGFQITPLQAVRYAAAIANGGSLVTPQLLKGATPMRQSVGVGDSVLQVVREGMRMAVSSEWPDRTGRALDMWGIDIAAKTGTAEIGERNQFMNSWVIGFWPANTPRYAFAVVLERAPAGTLSGAAPAMRGFFEWLVVNKPEYVGRQL